MYCTNRTQTERQRQRGGQFPQEHEAFLGSWKLSESEIEILSLAEENNLSQGDPDIAAVFLDTFTEDNSDWQNRPASTDHSNPPLSPYPNMIHVYVCVRARARACVCVNRHASLRAHSCMIVYIQIKYIHTSGKHPLLRCSLWTLKLMSLPARRWPLLKFKTTRVFVVVFPLRPSCCN